MTNLRGVALAVPGSSVQRRLLVTSAAIFTCVLFAVVSSFTSRAAWADDRPAASDPTVGPEHAIVCYTSPRTPFKTSSGLYIFGNTTWNCNYDPDACYYYSELQIWDYYEKRWVRAARKASSDCGALAPTRTLWAGYMCSAPATSFSWRTKGHLEAFHGTWDYTTKYSSSITLTC